MKEDQDVRAMQAVAMAGGLAPSARAQNSYLLKQGPNGQEVIAVDLTKIARGIRPPLMLQSGDTLVVGSGMLAKLAEFIKPSIGASASLTPGP
jgi:protein involved in polysaccharide export with SLBB domain